MPLNFLGKLLFPRQADWQRKKQAKIMFWVLVAAVIFGVGVAAVIFIENSKR